LKFSKLDFNEKTVAHITLYFDAIINKTPLISVGNKIQNIELQEHLCRVGNKTQEEILIWIDKNTKPFRCYLNSLATVANFLFIDYKINFRRGLNERIIYDAIVVWNDNLNIMEEVHVKDLM
jgi:hypothetical protein